MAKINPRLLGAIIDKTGLSQAQVYARIKQTASAEYLPRHLAAIRVGAANGVTINRYATADELAQLRSAGSPVTPPSPSPSYTASSPRPARSGPKRRTT